MGKRKCIFITGAASGIGRATAHLFARKGWYPGIVDLNMEGLQYLAHVLFFAFWALPFLRRPVVKHLCLSKG